MSQKQAVLLRNVSLWTYKDLSTVDNIILDGAKYMVWKAMSSHLYSQPRGL